MKTISRTERQELSLGRFRRALGIGTIHGCTGYGKTRIGIEAKKRMDKAKGWDIQLGVIVPTTSLFNQWSNLIKENNLKCCRVYTVQSMTQDREKKYADFWIYDEIHLYLDGEVFKTIFDLTIGTFKLGLTGTLKDEQIPKINEILPIIDTIPFQEAVKNGWVANVIEYNYYIDLIPEERDAYDTLSKEIKELFELFQFDLEYVRAASARVRNAYFQGRDDSQPRTYPGAEYVSRQVLTELEVDGILLRGEPLWEYLHFKAKDLNRAFEARRDLLLNFESVVLEAAKVIKHLDMKTITFGESNQAANKLHSLLGKRSGIYHSSLTTIAKEIKKYKKYKTQAAADRNASKLKDGRSFMSGSDWVVEYTTIQKITKEKQRDILLDKFTKDEIKYLISSKSFIVGLDVPNVQCGIKISTTNNHATHEQQIGRSARKEGDKIAYFVNIIPKNTKAVGAFRNAQINSINIRHVTSIEEILIENE